MSKNYSSKCKDSDPKQTIAIIRNIISNMGFLTIEVWYDSPVSNCYSVYVSIDGMNFGTYGKGISRELALASAYGEFIERLQNNILYLGDRNKSFYNYKGFKFYPDEKVLSIDEIINRNEFWLDCLFTKNTCFYNYNGVNSSTWLRKIHKYGEVIYNKENPDNLDDNIYFLTLPFYNVSRNIINYIPYQVLDLFYGSNGTCAGNTPEEAIVQGLSEIIERYVISKIIKDKIVPPNIPTSFLEKYPTSNNMIKEIEKNKDFKVYVKDCSLGEGLPVVAIVLIDTSSKTYMVRFGAHPVFEIALERCFTETFQGRNNIKVATINSFNYGDGKVESDVNLKNIYRIGKGSFPSEFFTSNYSYEFIPFSEVKEKSNKYMLKSLIEIFTKRNLEVLIRDVSFLGFPSFRVIIPDFSEIYTINYSKMEELPTLTEARIIMRKLHRATNDEIYRLSTYIDYIQKIAKENTLSSLLGLPIDNDYAKVSPSLKFLNILLNYKIGNRGYVLEQSGLFHNDEFNLEYFRCLKDFLYAKSNNENNNVIKDVLSKFYPEKTIDIILKQLSDPDNMFYYFYKTINCWDCSKCESKSICSYSLIHELLMKLKDIQAIRNIDQEKTFLPIFI